MARKDNNTGILLLLLGVVAFFGYETVSSATDKAKPNNSNANDLLPGGEQGDPTSYINDYKNAAQAVANAAPSPGISIAFILAQSGLETGWGKSDLFRLVNNAFGVTADSSWKGQTWQQSNANGVKFGPVYRAYPTVADSFADYLEVLLESQYAALWNSGTNDAITWAQIVGPIYDPANPNYSDILVGMIPQVQAILQH